MLFDSYPHITKSFQAMMEEYGRQVDFDEAKRPEMFTDVFDRAGIPYQLFR